MKRSIADPFGINEIHFRGCFSAPSFRIFVALVIGWVLTVGKHTISQVILTMRLHESKHFASIYRFLGKGRWEIDLVSYFVFRILVETLIAEGVEILGVIDDTLNKHSGKKICGAGWQHDGSLPKHTKQKGHGVCFVIIGLAIRLPGISDRMFCLPYAARLWWPPKAKIKPKSLPYKTKPELALDLINLTHSWLRQAERLRIVFDLGYCCDRILKARPRDVHITGRLRKDAALFGVLEPTTSCLRGRPRKRGYRLPTLETMFGEHNLRWTEISVFCYGKQTKLLVHQFAALWYHSAGQQPVSIVLCHDPAGHHANMVLFDTDLQARPEQIIERYVARCSIEVTNRETKNLLGAAEPQCRNENSVIRAPMFAYWAYCFVVLWFVRQFTTAKTLVADPAPWYGQKKSFTFSDMLAAARRSHFTLKIYSEANRINKLEKINNPRSTRGLDHARSAKL